MVTIQPLCSVEETEHSVSPDVLSDTNSSSILPYTQATEDTTYTTY